MKAVFLDFITVGPDTDISPLKAIVPDLVVHDLTPPESIAERIADAGIVCTNKCRLTRELIEGATDLKFIGLTATGYDNIDIGAARDNGVGVANLRDFCTESVSEHAIGTLLMLTHSLPQYHSLVRRGEWQNSSNPTMLAYPMRELAAMTLGIVGYGTLGRATAKLGRAFGMEVIVSARPGSADVPEGRVSFDELLERSDAISLHCPLNDDTRNLFGEDQFKRMKPDAYLINTGRGGLVDSAALADALQNGEIAGAAVDVLPTEPPVDGDPLLDYDGDKLIVTPHIAWGTHEARQRSIDMLADNVRAFLSGESLNRLC
jgi:glycerate dehydrogenase